MSRIGNLSSRIFVGGLDPAVDESDLEKAFALFGEITNVMVMRDRDNGRSRGFAFISFKDSMSSEDAISRMHGVEIRGRCVTVRHAERERFLDDKNHQGREGPVRERGAPVISRQPRDSQYGGQRYPISKTVFVTDDDPDYSRSSSYKRRRSPSPGNLGYSADGGKHVYRDRSPHDFDRRKTQSVQSSYYEDNSGGAAGRLSPTEELSAYVHSRYRDYSPLLDLAKQYRTDSRQVNEYPHRSRTGRSSPDQEPRRDTSDRPRQYQNSMERRRSPDVSTLHKPRGSYSRTSTGRDYVESEQRNDFDLRDERRPRNMTDSRRSDAERRSPQRFQRNQNVARDQSPNRSWDRNKRQRTPQSNYSEWSQDNSKTVRDQGKERSNEDFQRARRSGASEYEKGDDTSNGRGSRWNRNNRESDSYRPRNKPYDWKEQQSDMHRGRGMASTQSWKKDTSGRGTDVNRDHQRTNDYSSSDYRKSRYHSGGMEHGKSTESYHRDSSRSQSGRGTYQNNRGRRY